MYQTGPNDYVKLSLGTFVDYICISHKVVFHSEPVHEILVSGIFFCPFPMEFRLLFSQFEKKIPIFNFFFYYYFFFFSFLFYLEFPLSHHANTLTFAVLVAFLYNFLMFLSVFRYVAGGFYDNSGVSKSPSLPK